MVIGISNDFTSSVILDAELTATPDSGLYVNKGSHPLITVKNLLEFLPILSLDDFTNYNSATAYGNYSVSKSRADIVKYSGKLYQSKTASNTNNDPSTSTSNWLETNVESLVLKNFIDAAVSKMYSDLKLTKRLVSNHYIYEVGNQTVSLPNDYAGWVFEPKGSDYVSININQIAFQKSGTTSVNLYVINQGKLIDTLEITPSDGSVSFSNLGYKFKGKGQWIFAIDSTDVIRGNKVVMPDSFSGIYCFPVIGSGNAPESSSWVRSSVGNGLGFNVTATLESDVFIENNISNFGGLLKSTFEMLSFELFLSNPSARIALNERNMDEKILIAETKNSDVNTVFSRYIKELESAKEAISKSLDSELQQKEGLEIEINTP